MANLALIELGDKIVSTLRKNSSFFRSQLQLIRMCTEFNENNIKHMIMMNELRQQIFDSTTFFAVSYLDETTNYKFILNLASQLLAPDVCDNDVTIECLVILFSSTLAKVVCEDNVEMALINLLNQLQNIVHPSDTYSFLTKSKVKELISMGRHRFLLNVTVLKEPIKPLLFNHHDLQILRQNHQEYHASTLELEHE